ncbi:MAG: hypothetical protein ACRC8S_23205 [Fimbriiglobus sp.]
MMPWSRRMAVLLLVFGCLACLPSASQGQGVSDLKPFRLDAAQPTGDSLTRMLDLMNGKLLVKGPEEKRNKEVIGAFAKFIVYRVTHDSYHNLPDSGELKPRTAEQDLETIVSDLNSRLLIPTPEGNLSRLAPDQAQYIYEFGNAVDAALGDVFKKNPPSIIRVNAARLLSIASKSGAPVHGKMIVAMLSNTYFKDGAGKPLPTPPEVLYFALKAAENILAAYDPTVLTGTFVTRHSLVDTDLVALIKVLEEMIVKGPPVADRAATSALDLTGRPIDLAPEAPPMPTEPGKEAAKPATPKLTSEQINVVRYFRKAAVRALAKVRFDTLSTTTGAEVRPALTLAKVAVNDPSLSLPATTAEIAEATLGLVGMSPSQNLNLDVWTYAIAVGMNNFVRPRLPDDKDTSLPWRITSGRMMASFNALKKAIPISPRLRLNGKPITELADIVISDMLSIMEKDPSIGAGRPSNERLLQWLAANAPKEAAKSLYSDKPQYKFTVPPQ